MRVLAELDSSLINARTSYDGRLYPMHLAARDNRADVVRELHRLGARVDVQDDNGRVPMYYAVYYANTATMLALFELGAHPIAPYMCPHFEDRVDRVNKVIGFMRSQAAMRSKPFNLEQGVESSEQKQRRDTVIHR